MKQKKKRTPPRARNTPAAPESPGIILGQPAYGATLTCTWVYSVLPILMEGGLIDRIERCETDSHVGRARNTIAAKFLEGTGKWLAFIDTDIGFTTEDFKRIYAQALKHPEDITAGVYPLKRLTPGAVVNAMPGETPDETGLLKVRETGTGFMFIPRAALEKMQRECPEIAYTRDSGNEQLAGKPEWDFFQSGVWEYQGDPHFPDGHRRWLSEDYYFCQRHIALGGSIWLDCSLNLKHRGAMDFPPSEAAVKDAAAYYARLDAKRKEIAAKGGE